MGAWDSSLFGNDDAADFGDEFDDANSAATVAPILAEALDAVLGEEAYLEAPEGAVALAAAALVVAWTEPDLLGEDSAYTPQPWPRGNEPLPADLRTKAAAVFDRIKDPVENELFELWDESDKASEFTAEIDRWRSRLV